MSHENEKYKDATDSGSLEKGHVADVYALPPPVATGDDRYHFEATDLDRVQRRLKQRHVQMIAIAGTIGTGLFLGSGSALQGAGPLGALIAYALVGTVAYSSLCSIGEMTSLAPISGTFPHFAARWVDPSFGFAVGWNYFYTNAISVPVEISAATILISFWDTNNNHQAAYIAMMVVLVSAVNIFGVRWFGESEFYFSIIKIVLITGLILTGLIIDLGGGPHHDRIGFRYWKHPGPVAGAGLEPQDPNLDRFLAILTVIVQAGFSFQGMELVAIAASETENPRRNIGKAVGRVFWRIVIFYILGILVTGMLVPYDDPDLLNGGGTASESPYVIAIRRAGIKTLPSIINAAIFTSAFSAGNSYLFCSSRILYGLAIRGQAPKIFTYCTKKGLPLIAVLTCCSFSLLSFMNVSSGATKVFNWFVSLSTVGGFFTWFAINLTYYRFWCGHRAQGIDRKKLVYWNPLQPYLSMWGMFWTCFFILINGYTVFWNWNTADFLTSYINIPLFFALWGGYWIFKRTRFWRASEMDFVTGIPTLEETETPEIPPRNWREKLFNILF
ncbi:general APC amino acid permease [Auriscalpium vulgare]|uniref:General APC amino acid permease n=1 Tax=Auriscalpium vulgare TaxID=40419 RepID=A0ACB8S3T8_9AGAM|nr:general APC amino acid permease [Auriscalpium vulgare]